jgi:hypothetical protein
MKEEFFISVSLVSHFRYKIMKQSFTLLLFVCFTFQIAMAQSTGTIKIAKPKADPTVSPKPTPKILTIVPFVGANYALKQNKKFGWDGGLIFFPSFNKLQTNSEFGIGIEYSLQYQYYQLSSFNTKTSLAEIPFSKSENRQEYIKIPIQAMSPIHMGSHSIVLFVLEATPTYLLKNKNEFNRLTISDFNQFNIAATFGLGFSSIAHTKLYFSYSKIILNELKDKNLYDNSGLITGSQKSKTSLVSLSILYSVEMTKK